MISVIILTKNEEQDLPACLNALGWCDDIHVLDSGSTDKTLEIARQFDANIGFNPFKSFGQQRNFGLENLPLKHDWILFLDADEIVTYDFEKAVKTAVTEAPENIAGFYCCWKMMFEDRWLRYSDNYPKWQFRILKKGRANFTDFGHGQKEGVVDGEIGYIKAPYLHYSFSKGWTQWMDRHNKYSSLEALDRLKKRVTLEQIFSGHTSIRNPALKSLLSKLPGWPLLRFLHAYIFNFGFLEGTPGLIYCTNMAYHEFLIQIKMREIKIKERKRESVKRKFDLVETTLNPKRSNP